MDVEIEEEDVIQNYLCAFGLNSWADDGVLHEAGN